MEVALARARSTGSVFIATREELLKLSISDAYGAMLKTNALLVKEHQFKVKGFKVGATSPAVQQRMGLEGPFWGILYDKVVAPPRGGDVPRFSIKKDNVRGVETEFAFMIKKEIVPRSSKPYSGEELVKEFCSTVTPCVEVCGFRMRPTELASLAQGIIADTGNTSVVFPIDSFARNAADVYQELIGSKSTIQIDGVKVASGSGADVLGSPVKALEWFVQEACNGPAQMTIPEGTYVSTGATCGLIPITKACYMHAAFSGISNCDIHIAFRDQ